MSQELKVHYYLRHKELKNDGSAPIMGRITIGKSMVQFSPSVAYKYPSGIPSRRGQQEKARSPPN